MPEMDSGHAGNYSRKADASRTKARSASGRPELKYLVGGSREGLRENLRRGTAAAAVRKARQLLPQGYLGT
jgi:hypothetical protein